MLAEPDGSGGGFWLAEHAPDAADRFLDVRARVERAEAEVALACRTEAGAWRLVHLRLVEQLVEEVPRRRAVRRAQPHVGRVHTAEDREARGGEALADQPRVLHVERD